MLPGPDIYKHCSSCHQLIIEETLMSGNTFGAIYWSDGKREAPMLPQTPWLITCPHCKALLWIDALEKQINISSSEKKKALHYTTPSFNDYLSLLPLKKPSLRKETYLRVQAWWTSNDKRRDKPLLMTPIEQQNALALAELLDESDTNNVLMKAEIFREVEDFETAMTLLERIQDSAYEKPVMFLKRHVEERNPFVKQLIFD